MFKKSKDVDEETGIKFMRKRAIDYDEDVFIFDYMLRDESQHRLIIPRTFEFIYKNERYEIEEIWSQRQYVKKDAENEIGVKPRNEYLLGRVLAIKI